MSYGIDLLDALLFHYDRIYVTIKRRIVFDGYQHALFLSDTGDPIANENNASHWHIHLGETVKE